MGRRMNIEPVAHKVRRYPLVIHPIKGLRMIDLTFAFPVARVRSQLLTLGFNQSPSVLHAYIPSSRYSEYARDVRIPFNFKDFIMLSP